MSIFKRAAMVAFGPVIESAWTFIEPVLEPITEAAKGEVAERGAGAVKGFLTRQFGDGKNRLPKAMDRAVSRSWRALETALADDTWWSRLVKKPLPTEDRERAKEMRTFLNAAFGVEFEDGLRKQALEELEAARKRDDFTSGTLDAEALVAESGALALHIAPDGVVASLRRAANDFGEECRRAGFPNLAAVVSEKVGERGTTFSLLVEYFLRREIENDPALQRSMMFVRWCKLEASQAEGFKNLDGWIDSFEAALLAARDRIDAAADGLDASDVAAAVSANNAAIDAAARDLELLLEGVAKPKAAPQVERHEPPVELRPSTTPYVAQRLDTSCVFNGDSALLRFAFADDPRYVLACDAGGQARLVELASGREMRRATFLCGPWNLRGFNDLDVSRDRRFVASGHRDGALRVWRLLFSQTKDPLFEISVGGGVGAVAFDKDTTLIAVGAGLGGAVSILRFGETETRHLLDLGDIVRGLRFLDDGRSLVAGSGTRVVVVDTATKEVLRRFKHEGFIADHALSPNASRIAVAYGAGVSVWDLASGKEFVRLDSGDAKSEGVVFGRSADELFVGKADGAVVAHDLASGTNRTLARRGVTRCDCLAVSPDRSLLAVGGFSAAFEIIDLRSA